MEQFGEATVIPRITRGRSGYGALSYDHGPGRRDEHRNAHKVGGNIAGKTWKQRSATMDDHVRRMHPKLTKPITRTSLRLAPEDRNLTDREWRAVAERYVEQMGYANGPWEAVRHADDHIHLTMSRVQWDGGVVDQWKDKTRAQSAVRDIEREHRLVDASSRYNRELPQLSRNDVERSARASELTGRVVDPEKQRLRDRVAAAEQASGGTRDGFERELDARGVGYRANISGPTERNPHGKMNGYSYQLDGHTDATGEPVWFKASHLGQRYGWTQTSSRLSELQRTMSHDATTVDEGKAAQSDSGAVARQRHVPLSPTLNAADTTRQAPMTTARERYRAAYSRGGDESVPAEGQEPVRQHQAVTEVDSPERAAAREKYRAAQRRRHDDNTRDDERGRER